MRANSVTKLIASLLICMALSSSSWAQDPGQPDTIKIADVSAGVGLTIAVPITLFNDEELTEIVIPLVIHGFSGWAKFDSISYNGGRLSNPDYLNDRTGFIFATDTFSVDSLVMVFSIGTGTALPAGDGKLCDLWFSTGFGGAVNIDSLGDSPYGRLQLSGSGDDSFTPEFQSGSIDIACDYLIGDVRPTGNVNVEDLMGIHKGYLGCFDFDNRYPWYADINCDRRIDLRDVVNLADIVWRTDSLGIACECGTHGPTYYYDPGVPDTVWLENDSVYVGEETTIDLSIVNDESLRGFAFALEWDGDAILDSIYYEPTARINSLDLFLGHYVCEGQNQINPDTIYTATWFARSSIPVGSEAVVQITFTALSEGTATFRLVDYYTYDRFTPASGPESMLVTEDKAAILPVVAGGQISVIPPICGDANADKAINIGDPVYLINYVFKNGNPPSPECIGDANGDGSINVGDATYLIGYVFKSGAAPPNTCCP